LTGSVVEGRFQCIYFYHYPAPRTPLCRSPALKSAQAHEQLLHGICLRMHIAHRRLNVIVAGHVLQCKRVGMLAGLGQECVTLTVQAGVRMGLNSRSRSPI
jgi:hypothetical protein